jgi:hypothetical protein
MKRPRAWHRSRSSGKVFDRLLREVEQVEEREQDEIELGQERLLAEQAVEEQMREHAERWVRQVRERKGQAGD